MPSFMEDERRQRPHQTGAANGATASTLWIVVLTLASTVATLALACATPFTALAALAATQMRARDGAPLMLLAWAVSQIVGFGLHNYPRDASTIAWGVALGMAAVACVIAARQAVNRVGNRSMLIQMAVAYLVATIAFKAVILLWSFGLGGVETTLSPSINARQFVRNGAILIGLYALCRGLLAVGMPLMPREPARQC